MPDSTTLLISPDHSLTETVQGIVQSIHELRLEVLAGFEEAGSHLQRGNVVLVLVHLRGPDAANEVTALLYKLTTAGRPVPVLVLSDHPHASQELALLRKGVVEYLSRPLDTRRLAYLMEMLTVRARLVAAPPASLPPLADVKSLGDGEPFFYGPDSGMEQVKQVAPLETTLLLTGETGTGKTRLARLIHELSPRRREPFLAVNCGSLSANLIDSEMFGHVRGAFTGADRERTGKFADVGQGTLLLDEVDALGLELQAKLLHVLEDRVFHLVGSNKEVSFQARLLVASNRNLEHEVSAGRFRADLYYRLNVVAFFLPPLRERVYLISALASYFLAEFSRRHNRPVHGIVPAAVQALEEYTWPGNIRELRNIIERAVALCRGPVIQLEDLPAVQARPAPPEPGLSGVAPAFAGAAPSTWSTLHKTKEEAENHCIRQALLRNQNNRLRAAAELGVSRMTLYKKLHKYGLL